MIAAVRKSRRRGLVLIIVISCLAALALVGVTFTVLNSLERTTAGNYRLTVQARLTARSGVEYAVSRLAGPQALASAHIDGGEWKYYGNDASGVDPNLRNVALTTAKRPSYALMSSTGKVEQVRIKYDDSRIYSVGVSGRLKGGEYFNDGNIYSLEVQDLSGCVYVNDGLKLMGGNKSSVSQNLRRILNILGRQGKIGSPNLGDIIVDNRPTIGGYGTWHHLEYVLRTKANLKDEVITDLKRMVTVYGWTDKNVVNPVPFGPSTARFYPVMYERGDLAVYRRGPGRDNRNLVQPGINELGWVEGPAEEGLGGTTAAVYGLDELFPGYVEVVHRAPININTATQEVLTALIADLRGVFLMEKRSRAPFDSSPGDLPYQGTQWVNGVHNFRVPQNKGTWEYMGHTYSRASWQGPGAVTENKKWDEWIGGAGATTQSGSEGGGGQFQDRDELGFLTATVPFSLSGTRASAMTIARQIIECREGKGEYGALPFGGSFKTWAQFHEFCDYLARNSFLVDERFPEEHCRRQGAQAMADVLKANFNPNYTPNEINPDRNLYLMVDKTDLIVNSTEFCLLPTGFFQINSIGRILREDPEKSNNGKVYDAVAVAGARAVVQVHEIYRETTQRQFYRGDAPPTKTPGITNNGLTVETGPESDNGPLIYGDHFNSGRQRMSHELDGDAQYYEPGYEFDSGWGYEASGYLALPTAGGPDEVKDKFTLISTQPLPGSHDNAANIFTVEPRMHAHYRFDDRLHFNQSGNVQLQSGGDPRLFTENMASVLMSGSRQLIVKKVVYNPATCSAVIVEQFVQTAAVEKASNFPDPGEEISGEDGASTYSPYDPTDGIRYRLVRSFRQPLEGRGTDRPRLLSVAPSDLRVDGMYVERNSGLAYWIDEEGSAVNPPGGGYSFDTRHGVATFWFKPGFDPRFSGKARTLASAARYHRANFHYRNPSPFTLYYFPSFSGGEIESLPRRTQFVGRYPEVPEGFDPIALHSQLPLVVHPEFIGLEQIARSSLVFQVAWGAFAGSGWDMEGNAAPGGPISSPAPAEPVIPKAEYFEKYGVTPSLNGNLEGWFEHDTDYLRGHRWTHIAMMWNLLPSGPVADPDFQPSLKVAVNGMILGPVAESEVGPTHFEDWGKNELYYPSLSVPERPNFSVQSFWDQDHPQNPRMYVGPEDTPTNKAIVNTFRLGEVSTHSFNPFPRNFSSDGTYDEFYMFTEGFDGGLNSIVKPAFAQGRYVMSGGEGSTVEAKWTSPALKMQSQSRKLAKPTSASAPGSKSGSSNNFIDPKALETMPRMLGVSWTWYAERYATVGTTMQPIMVDYNRPETPTAIYLNTPAVRVQFTPEGQPSYPLNDEGGYSNDGFSPIENARGAPVVLDKDGYFRYSVRFKIEAGLSPNGGGSSGGGSSGGGGKTEDPPPSDPPPTDPPPAPVPPPGGVPPPPPPPPPQAPPPAPPISPPMPPSPPPPPAAPQPNSMMPRTEIPAAVLISYEQDPPTTEGPQEPPPPPQEPPPPPQEPPPVPGVPPAPPANPGSGTGTGSRQPVYLATPIFDDVTFYFQTDTPRILELVITTEFDGELVITDTPPVNAPYVPGTLKSLPPPPPKPPKPPPLPPLPPLPPPAPPPKPPPSVIPIPPPPPPAPPQAPPPMPPPAPPSPPPAPPSNPPPAPPPSNPPPPQNPPPAPPQAPPSNPPPPPWNPPPPQNPPPGPPAPPPYTPPPPMPPVPPPC